MWSIFKVLSALALPLLIQATPTPEARSASRAGQGSICSTKKFDIEAMFSEMFATGQDTLPKPVAKYPTFVGLSVGYQNYSCLSNGTWFNIGAITELFDISCIPDESIAPFTAFVANFWEAAGPSVSPWDVVNLATDGASSNFSLGIHYWINTPGSSDPLSINAVWDFSQQRLKNDANAKNAFVVGNGSGKALSPDNGTFDAPWVSSSVFMLDGKKDGLLADQVYRIHTHDGNYPTGSCTPGQPQALVKSTLNFWLYGGAWADTIF